MRGVAAIVYGGPMAKFFSWTIFIHDFELYPFDRELSDDFVQILVMGNQFEFDQVITSSMLKLYRMYILETALSEVQRAQPNRQGLF